MKRLIIAIIAATQLTACAGASWHHNYKTGSEAQSDLSYCQYETEKYGFVPMQWGAGTGAAVVAGIEEGSRRNKLMSQCMKMKGYYLARNK